MKYLFVRHAESEKNINEITGGKGDKLTEKGISQVEDFINSININNDSVRAICSDSIQAIETCELIADYYKIGFEINADLRSLYFGTMTGMSTKEMMEKCPEDYNRLTLWREKLIDVSKLNLKGMEDPMSLWNRVMNFLSTNYFKEKICIVVVTRSIMVLIYNYIEGHHPKQGNYMHYEFEYCDRICFDYDIESKHPVLDINLTKLTYL